MNEALVGDLHDLRSEAALTEKHIRIHQEQHMTRELSRLQEQSQQQVEKLKGDYAKRVEKIRRGTRQELANAIAEIKGEFMTWHEKELADALESAMADMQGAQAGDSRKKSLAPAAYAGSGAAQLEIKKLQDQVERLEADLERERSKEPSVIVDNSAVEAAEKATRKAKQQIDLLEAEKNKLEITIKKHEKTERDLNEKIKAISQEAAASEKKIKELDASLKEVQKQLQVERLEAAKKLIEVKEQAEQKLKEQEKEMQASIKALETQAAELNDKLTKSNKKLNQAQSQAAKASDEAKKAAEAAKKAEAAQRNVDSAKKQSKEVDDELATSGFSAEAMQVINELKKRLERTERMYKKQTEVLSAQMHALKDEAFIRSQLERDALLLHKVDLRYAKSNQPRVHTPVSQTANSQLAPNPAVISELHRLINLPQMKRQVDNVLPEIRPRTTPAGAKHSSSTLEARASNTPRAPLDQSIDAADLEGVEAFEV